MKILKNQEIIITSAIRTAVGSLGKSLKNIKAEELGSAVISASTEISKIKKMMLMKLLWVKFLLQQVAKTQLGKLL
mgnify:CR=1 FL=1